MNVKQKTIGIGYVNNIEQFEKFIRDLLTYAFRSIRNKKSFEKYLSNEDELESNLSDSLDWIHNFWWDNTSELIDMMIHARATDSENQFEYEDELVNNLPAAYEKRMHRAGIDLYGAFAEQVFRYSEEKLKDDHPVALFNLLKELEDKYGRSNIQN